MPHRNQEARGIVEEIAGEPGAKFCLHLDDRYEGPLTGIPVDATDRVIFVVHPTAIVCTRRHATPSQGRARPTATTEKC